MSKNDPYYNQNSVITDHVIKRFELYIHVLAGPISVVGSASLMPCIWDIMGSIPGSGTFSQSLVVSYW